MNQVRQPFCFCAPGPASSKMIQTGRSLCQIPRGAKGRNKRRQGHPGWIPATDGSCRLCRCLGVQWGDSTPIPFFLKLSGGSQGVSFCLSTSAGQL